jgi:hypothetical protein
MWHWQLHVPECREWHTRFAYIPEQSGSFWWWHTWQLCMNIRTRQKFLQTEQRGVIEEILGSDLDCTPRCAGWVFWWFTLDSPHDYCKPRPWSPLYILNYPLLTVNLVSYLMQKNAIAHHKSVPYMNCKFLVGANTQLNFCRDCKDLILMWVPKQGGNSCRTAVSVLSLAEYQGRTNISILCSFIWV